MMHAWAAAEEKIVTTDLAHRYTIFLCSLPSFIKGHHHQLDNHHK